MTYREKLAKIIDLEASRLLAVVTALDEPTCVNMEKLERLCRCAKILGDERAPDPEAGPEDDELLQRAAGGT